MIFFYLTPPKARLGRKKGSCSRVLAWTRWAQV